jgi:hypothetical protein
MQPGPYSPDYYAVGNDYNPSANDPQYILTHQYAKTILYSEAHPSTDDCSVDFSDFALFANQWLD